MKRILTVAFGALLIVGLSHVVTAQQQSNGAQQPYGGAQLNVPEIPFDSSVDFLKLPSEMHFGETSGVAVNSKKHIFVFNRGNTTGPAYGATASQVLEFDHFQKVQDPYF